MSRGRCRALLCALLAGLWVHAAAAAGPGWSQLNAQERKILAPLQDVWDQLEDKRKSKWRRIAALYPKMNAEEQARVQQRMKQWVSLSPEQRQVARDAYKQHEALAPQKKRELAEKWRAFRKLPPEKRHELAQGSHPETGSPGNTPLPKQAADAGAARPGESVPDATGGAGISQRKAPP